MAGHLVSRRPVFIALLTLLPVGVLGPREASAATIELLTNGSFETGDFTGWTAVQTSAPLVPWTVSSAGAGSGFFPLTSPQDGIYVAWNGFDGDGPMSFLLYQDVFIPEAGDATLSWQQRLQWDFALTGAATLPRSLSVALLDPLTSAVLATLFTFSTGTGLVVGDTGWATHVHDVSAYAGQTVRLLFAEFVPESFTGPGQAEFDAISITASVPEPSQLLLVGAGVVAFCLTRRRASGSRVRARHETGYRATETQRQ
jgi:hypothetical protein